MRLSALPSYKTQRYTLAIIQEEVRQLLSLGRITRYQPIYVLCQYIPAREWLNVEDELAAGDFLLRDAIGDLVGIEKWDND